MTEFPHKNIFIKNTLEFHKRSFSSLNYIRLFFRNDINCIITPLQYAEQTR